MRAHVRERGAAGSEAIKIAVARFLESWKKTSVFAWKMMNMCYWLSLRFCIDIVPCIISMDDHVTAHVVYAGRCGWMDNELR